ncbi:lipoprotein-anchoring transpeptidase ErfK/SrfK [Thermocatellispora tengchongensis]|uniref:Lipoprotein-anchoring transpeptidase ErfK/SrfK n=1 Tax=Thermocatellispora tengchongensis TaxID=1073253 RepID=A0A840PIY7_9ACTN|nr:L,D-transpeptidase [Thermocatellispora tengchongensis]MBB5139498.1 lipoprotein-anchoring transpeptidase ErfK/SrfK [Thermocatellispora tengchongensis]
MGLRVPKGIPHRRILCVAALLALATGSSVSFATGADSLPQATTYTTLPRAPRDTAPFSAGTGVVVHPTAPRVVRATPGGAAVAVLPSLQLGNPTWVPVVDTAPGWIKVLLPSRPNRATGWISGRGDDLQVARTPYLIKVETGARRLTVLKSGRVTGQWTVAVGAPGTPTPLGRTFLLASLSASDQRSGSPVLPTGAHSATLDTYGGGPGTVAFHGWPRKTVFGKAVSHGCVRVPDDALRALSRVPLGTLVIITR